MVCMLPLGRSESWGSVARFWAIDAQEAENILRLKVKP